MNHIYRIVWNASLGKLQAVSELGRSQCAGGASGAGGGLHRALAGGLSVAMWIALLCMASPSAHAVTYYWDLNGATAGSGGPAPSGTWSTGGTTWSTSSTGALATGAVTTAVGDSVNLSAGNDATGAYTITLNGAQTTSTLVFKNGNVTLAGGTLTVGNITADTTPDTIASVIAGNNINLTGPAASFLTLTGTNINTGNFRIQGGVTLNLNASGGNAVSAGFLIVGSSGAAGTPLVRLQAANQIKDTTGVLLGSTATINPIFEMNGFNDTIDGITISGAAGTAIFRNGAATDATVTLAGTSAYATGAAGNPQTGRSITDGAGGGKLNVVVAMGVGGVQTFAGTEANYTGTTTINSGTLKLWNTSTWASNVILNGGTLQLDQTTAAGQTYVADAATRTHANTITGTGGTLRKSSDGTVILTGANSYQGPTLVSLGTLQAGSSTAFGSNSAVTLANAASTLALNNFNVSIGSLAGGGAAGGTVTLGTGTLTTGGDNTSTSFAGVISGTGALVKTGTGTQTLTGSNLYTGNTTISAGTLQIGNGGTIGSIVGDVNDNGLLTFNHSDAITFGGLVSGSGALTQQGAGTLTLTGNNSYTGGTTISAGTLQIGNGGTVGSIVGNVNDNGALTFNRSDAITLGGIISGSGTLTQQGTGTLTLTGNNSYTGGTTISAGTLSVGNGGTSGSITGNVVDNGTLVFNRSDNSSYAGIISGAGALVKTGTGLLILNGNSAAFTGATTVSGGTLEVGDINTPTAALGGNVTVDLAGTLRGHGTVGGNVSNNGTVAPGGSIGILSVLGNYTQAPGATLTIEVNPSTASQLKVTGSAALAGTLSVVYDPGTYTARRYAIVTAGGGVTGTFATLNKTTIGVVTFGRLLQSVDYLANEVDLVLAEPFVISPQQSTIFTALGSTLALGGQAANSTLLGRLDSPLDPGRSLWFHATDGHTRVGNTDVISGFQSDQYGFLAGHDEPVGDYTLGVAAGYSHANISDLTTPSTGATDTLRAAVYGKRQWGSLT